MNLTLENCADFVLSSTPEDIREAVKEMGREEDAAKQALQQKCTDYFGLKDQQYQRIVDQIEKVQAQREAVEKEKARHERAMVEATLSGNDEVIAAIQKELERCASALASFTAQIEMFRDYEIKGDPALFAEIEMDSAALYELISTNKQIKEAMYAVTEEIKNAWRVAIYDMDNVQFVSNDYKEPWNTQLERVQKDKLKAPETVGAKIDKKQAAIEAAEQRRRDAAQQPGNVVHTTHTTVVRRPAE